GRLEFKFALVPLLVFIVWSVSQDRRRELQSQIDASSRKYLNHSQFDIKQSKSFAQPSSGRLLKKYLYWRSQTSREGKRDPPEKCFYVAINDAIRNTRAALEFISTV
ncbi:unnamed protein product, partial [Amoebophrya sp. A120]